MFIDASSATELISLEDVARQLRILDGQDEGVDLERVLKSARAAAERIAARTFRGSVTRTIWYDAWPSSPAELPWPPVASVTSVDYYDPDGNDTNVASSNYHLVNPTEGKAYLHWDDGYALPAVEQRPDAVRIKYVTGGSLPDDARHAILLLCELYYGDDGEPLSHLRQKSLEDRAVDLLGNLDAQIY